MDGEGGGGHEVAVPEPLPGGQCAQGGGEEPGGEGVARADGRDHVDAQGAYERGGVGGALAGLRRRAVRRGLLEHGRPVPALLDDEDGRFRQRLADRPCPGQPPGGAGLVVPDEHDVRAAREVEQDAWSVGVAPQPGAVVDVEGDEGAPRAGRGEFAHQAEAVLGQRGGDAGQVQYAARAQGVQVHVVLGHRGGGGSGPVVRDLVGVARPVARRAEVDARRARGIPSYGGGVDAVRGDRLDEVVAEPVGADPADPARGVPGRGEHARHVGLGSADPPFERRHVGEAPGPGGQERDHGLAERDDIHDVRGVDRSVGGHDVWGSSFSRPTGTGRHR